MTSTPQEWKFESRFHQFEPPDLLWAEIQGVSTLEGVTRSVEIYRQLGTVRPFFLLVDMKEEGVMDSEARHYLNEHLRPEWLLAVVCFNTRLLNRAFVKGLLLIYEMTRMEKHPLRDKIYFVSTRAEARALYVRLRAQQDPPDSSQP